MTRPLSRFEHIFHIFVVMLILNLLQIKLDIAEQDSQEFNGYDASNALILPSKKRDSKFKKNPDATNVTRILSKKQRKNLEKIVDKKKKREQVIPIATESIVYVSSAPRESYTLIFYVHNLEIIIA